MLTVIDHASEIAQCEFAREYSISVETLSRRFAALRKKGWVSTRPEGAQRKNLPPDGQGKTYVANGASFLAKRSEMIVLRG